jgi:hypothetical protein
MEHNKIKTPTTSLLLTMEAKYIPNNIGNTTSMDIIIIDGIVI